MLSPSVLPPCPHQSMMGHINMGQTVCNSPAMNVLGSQQLLLLIMNGLVRMQTSVFFSHG